MLSDVVREVNVSKAGDDISARDVAATEDVITTNVTGSCCRELLLSVLAITCNVGLRISDKIVDPNSTSEDGDNVGYGDMYSEETAVSLDSVDNVELTGVANSAIMFKDDCCPLTSIDSSDDSNINSRGVDDVNSTGVLTAEKVSELDPEGVIKLDEVPYCATLVEDAEVISDSVII